MLNVAYIFLGLLVFKANYHLSHPECYDVDRGEPCQECVDLYGEVKEELRSLGFRFRPGGIRC